MCIRSFSAFCDAQLNTARLLPSLFMLFGVWVKSPRENWTKFCFESTMLATDLPTKRQFYLLLKHCKTSRSCAMINSIIILQSFEITRIQYTPNVTTAGIQQLHLNGTNYDMIKFQNNALLSSFVPAPTVQPFIVAYIRINRFSRLFRRVI